ncbi:type II toxin-antitoxin system VapB family antitoxin [Streptomyces sp. H10-C2]|uniref:type II toxin-antitoxin system VapB family antitoxin n=1 Tax=unclassified Streptomyces TaxID=2593676 RepID=UPI0024BA7661|nr:MULTISPECIES: type II toxin-antitoxin system VapB family antitoxin [unclassified Streptomyces]MDJ0344987.1 type II toxin-antitoxin system VapB family antitoxin [Streptomyces sp. PH10-H1]MDJ0373932.1 type II toxin-antitoxin system VapB family antitoxin [Streptomyces sp. H10-C2]
MTKRLVDVDDATLAKAMEALGTATLEDTVNEALRFVVGKREEAKKRPWEKLSAKGPPRPGMARP